jgi:AmmeMemoRadiSam system protein A
MQLYCIPAPIRSATADEHKGGVMSNSLTNEEKLILLKVAREALEHGVTGKGLPPLDQNVLTPNLIEQGASFVTLTINTELRGCIGTLEAYQPLVEDVREHAIAAALKDPRFPPVTPAELNRIKLEISRLTAPLPLEYSSAGDLIKKLKPHVDGVVLKNGNRRATFLPQVWEKIPDPVEFLEHLCRKMGMKENDWRILPMDVLVYQVEEFQEEN